MSKDIARGIQQLKAVIASHPASEYFDAPVHHFFGDGTYCRVMQLQAGDVIVGKQHRLDHVVVVLTGEMLVESANGERGDYVAGSVFESAAGAQRAIAAVTDCAMMTIHPNPTNTRDMAELEAYLIASEDEK